MNSRTGKSLVAYLAAVVLSLVIFEWATGILRVGIGIPPYEGDNFWAQSLVKGLIRGEWLPFGVPQSHYLGAPYGYRQTEFPVPEGWLQLIIWVIGWFTRDSATALNLFYAVGFPLSCITFVYAARKLRVDRVTAVVCGLLFSALPYHLERRGHVFLAAYFFLPLFSVVLLKLWGRRPLWPHWKKSKAGLDTSQPRLALLTCVLAAGGGIYYGFFYCFFVILSALAAAIYRKSLKHLLSGLLIVALTGVLTAIALLPYQRYAAHYGKSPEVSQRAPVDTNTFGLKISSLVLPRPDHRIAALAKPAQRFEIPMARVEGDQEALGLAGLTGLLIVLSSFAFARRGTATGRLGLLAAAGLLFFTVASGASLFSLLVTPQIRAVNRVSIYIGLFALLGLAIALARLRFYLRARGLGAVYPLVAGVFLVLGLFDQVPPTFRERSSAHADEFLDDREFFAKIESRLNREAGPSPRDGQESPMILQLPFSGFPETGNVQQMHGYMPWSGYLQSDRLRWSFPALKGRPAADVIRALSELPPQELLLKAAQMGYSGILIDRRGYADRGHMLEKNLITSLGLSRGQPDLTSTSGHRSFFDIVNYTNQVKTRFNSRKARAAVAVKLSRGFYGPEGPTQKAGARKESTLEIINDNDYPQRLLIKASLSARSPRSERSATTGADPEAASVAVEIEGPGYTHQVDISTVPVELVIPLTVPPGRTALRLTAVGAASPRHQDGRPEYYVLESLNYELED